MAGLLLWQAEDEHPYALHTYLLEELNKLGLAYVHFIEPRAPHSMGVKSPNAEFNFQQRDQNLDVRTLPLLSSACLSLSQVLSHLAQALILDAACSQQTLCLWA